LNRERVLVVDEVSDTAEVLQAVLEPRGVAVNRVRRLDSNVAFTNENRPAVVVLNAEALNHSTAADLAGWQDVPQVILGTLRVPASAGEPVGGGPARRILHKPFHFAELITAIEALIGKARSAA
jgi:DNA-binding response OmpR family regulator